MRYTFGMRRLVWLVLMFPLLLSSCTEIAHFLGLDKDYFADYRGKNLLANYPFESADKWKLTTTTSYMSWELPTEAGVVKSFLDTTDPANPVTYPAYRLEIKNLIPDGDFEEEADGDTSFKRSFWALRVFSGTSEILFGTALKTLGSVTLTGEARTMDHRALWWDANASGNQLQLSLDQALGSLWQPSAYRIRFDFINLTIGPSFDLFLMANSTDLLASVVDAQGDGRWYFTDTPTDQVTRIKVSRTFTVDSTKPARVLNFGPSNPSDTIANKAIIDNIRLLQSDKDLGVMATFPSLSSAAGASLPLLPGSDVGAYTLKVRVCDDASADQFGASGAAHAPNRFYPQGLTVVLKAKVKSKTASYSKFFPRTAQWSSWTTLELPVGFDFVTTDPTDGTPVLTIEFIPANSVDNTLEGLDVGSLLLAHPTLVFNP